MNKLNKKSIFAIFGLVLVLAISFVLPLGTAFADYEDLLLDPNAMVNFNQLITTQLNYSNTTTDGRNFFSCLFTIDGSLVDNHTISTPLYVNFIYTPTNNRSGTLSLYHSGSNADITVYSQNNFSVVANHKYLVRYDIVSANPSIVGGLKVKDLIFIDLTLMFGAGNEPTISQCDELFVSDYYGYSMGTAVSLNGFSSYSDAYSNGYNDALSNLDSVFEGNLLANNIFGVNCDVAVGTSYGIDFTVGNASTSSTANFSIFGFNFPNQLLSGDTITLHFDTIGIWSDTSYKHFEIGDYYNGVFVTYADIDLTQYDYSTLLSFNNYHNIDNSISLNKSMSTIYFKIYGRSENAFGLFDGVQITARSLNLSFTIANAYDSGYASAEEYYKQYYSNGGAGYQSIYNKGYYDYPNDDHYTFRDLIVATIDTPIKAFTTLFDYDILGVNMKTFYLSLFTLAVIITIIRLVL